MRTPLLIALAAAGAAAAIPAQAQEAGDWLVRARAIAVVPNEDAGAVLPSFPTGTVSVENDVVPELDFTYFISKNISAELILATSKHNVIGAGALSGLGEVADSWVLPPTLTLQYRPLPEGKVHPYVGAGLNYTIFYNTDASSSLVTAIGATDVKMKDSFGPAAQIGVDIDLTDRVSLNLDAKWIDMDTTTTLTTGALVNKVDVSIDPFVLGVGVGIRF
ncbi:OmpW family protein [Sphingomonas canadensis]|uniref:OmpW family protein n=1 Tax=Sphingomonas canadensis TaxID=1219257 RepID=A0ABW3H8J4_9SPHN|nr:OmpW family outer membrane protein [Sphingomonas canadensis]MCW3837422.1 outer membrane beta-barrel protein [Sphingomonas canadensis]